MNPRLASLALLVSLPATGAGMVTVPRAEGYCGSVPDKSAVCFEWRMAFDPDVRFLAYGYEDGIDYWFSRKSGDGRYQTIVAVHPVLRDESRPGRVFWGYPWDITDVALPDSGSDDAMLVSFGHGIVAEGEADPPEGQKRVPAVLFVGRTTQPETTVEVEDFVPLSLHEVRAKAGE
ncbi:conserved exported hypothetical protein [uncultured Defluviicoccus sp.]|uniref:Uncharacterized protein n=1 Tax=metagenome TaxID=256318 RepID=A0A380TE10_9ZZZZ|nr:conserved exported hypothetical protein [uncultured Defluviicoccus sp.]